MRQQVVILCVWLIVEKVVVIFVLVVAGWMKIACHIATSSNNDKGC